MFNWCRFQFLCFSPLMWHFLPEEWFLFYFFFAPRYVAIKTFPVSKCGCGEPISPLASMLQGSYTIYKCKLTYILWSTGTVLPNSTIGHDHKSLIVAGNLLWCEGSGKLFAHVLNENLSTFVFKNFVLSIILHHLRKSFIKLLLPVSWKLLPLPSTDTMICSSQFRQPTVNFFAVDVDTLFSWKYCIHFFFSSLMKRVLHFWMTQMLLECVRFMQQYEQMIHPWWWIIHYFTMLCLNFAVCICGAKNTTTWHRGSWDWWNGLSVYELVLFNAQPVSTRNGTFLAGLQYVFSFKFWKGLF